MQSNIVVLIDPALSGLTTVRLCCTVSDPKTYVLITRKGRKVVHARYLQPQLHSVLASCRSRTSVTMASTPNGHKRNEIQLFVLSGTEAPELQELKNLPEAVKLLGTGRPDKECKSRLTGLNCIGNSHLLMQRSMQAGASRTGAKSRCFSNVEQGKMHQQSRSYRCCVLIFLSTHMHHLQAHTHPNLCCFLCKRSQHLYTSHTVERHNACNILSADSGQSDRFSVQLHF